METKQIQKRFNNYSVKMVVVSALALILLIPTLWIQDIIKERIRLKDNIDEELSEQWGKRQTLSGPVLNVPVIYLQSKDQEEGFVERKTIVHLLPETLNVDATINPQVRKRGIYKIPVYQNHVSMKGVFTNLKIENLGFEPAKILWDEAYFTLGISDLRGIKDSVSLKFNASQTTVEPGVADSDLFSSGITIKTDSIDDREPIAFEIRFSLNGSTGFWVEALGKTTEVKMNSTWANPSFVGSFLPTERKVDKNGFTAKWIVTHLNRNFPQQWAGKKFDTTDARLGVSLLLPVDHYQKSTRSVKYAILFIALNFIVFLFIEIRNKKRIHPFQYSLVALALLLFYTLLTSLGEQIGFNTAYAVSALAITGLISWYSYSIIENIKAAVTIALLQLGLYTFLFTILQLQDYALLMGSIGLFVILGIIMQASQKIKWYNEN
jgi:inner membrane protein